MGPLPLGRAHWAGPNRPGQLGPGPLVGPLGPTQWAQPSGPGQMGPAHWAWPDRQGILLYGQGVRLAKQAVISFDTS